MSRPRRRERASEATRLAEIGLGLALLLSVAALGGAAPWLGLPLLGVVMLAAAFACLGAWKEERRLHLTSLGAVFVLTLAVCTLQLVPLPAWALGILSPRLAALREETLVPLGLDGARPLSLDPSATWRELGRHLLLFIAFLTAVHVARTPGRRRALLAWVALTSAAVAVAGVGHALVGANTLFGMLSFQEAAPPLLTPFGNPNHLAAFTAAGATCALGLALSAKSRQWMALWFGPYLASVLGLALSLSRGGIVVFVASQLVLALLLARRAAVNLKPEEVARSLPVLRRLRAAPAVVWGVVALLVAGSAGGYAAWEGLRAEAATLDSVDALRRSKLEHWPDMVEAAFAHPFGAGRGAFEPAFTAFQSRAPWNVFTHAENVVLQLGVDFGPVLALLLMAAAVLALFIALRRRALDTVQTTALVVGAAAVVHDLFDFSLELVPMSLVLAMMAAIVCAPPPRTWDEEAWTSSWAGRFPKLRPAVAGAALVGLGLVTGLAMYAGQPSARGAGALLAELTQRKFPAREIEAAALPLIDRHPADFFLYEQVAHAYTSGEDVDPARALAFANRALQLRPIDGEAHRIAARALLGMGRRAQAMLEYKLAYEAIGANVLSEAVDAARGEDELRRIVPAKPAVVVDVIHHLWTRARREEAVALAEWARAGFGTTPAAAPIWVASARCALELGDARAALAFAQKAASLDPGIPLATVYRAQALKALGRRNEAIDVLQNGLVRHVGNFALATTLAGYLHEAGLKSQAREVLDRLGPFLRTNGERAEVHVLQARLYLAEGRYTRALNGFISASRLRPDDAALRYEVARLYEKLGRPAEALREVREAARLEGRLSEATTQWLVRLENAEAAAEHQRQERMLLGTESVPELIDLPETIDD